MAEKIEDVLGMAMSEEIVLPTEEKMQGLNSSVQDLVEMRVRIEAAEEALKKMKANELRLSTEIIPAKMDECGFAAVKLPNGRMVSCKAFYSGKIIAEREDQAFDWLEENDHGGVIKGEASFGFNRNEREEMMEWLRIVKETTEREAVVKLSVHHATMKALVREIVEAGDTLPPHLFDVYIGRQTVLK